MVPAVGLLRADRVMDEILRLLAHGGRADDAEIDLEGVEMVALVEQEAEPAVEPGGIGPVFVDQGVTLDILRSKQALSHTEVDPRNAVIVEQGQVSVHRHQPVRHLVLGRQPGESDAVGVVLVGIRDDVVLPLQGERALESGKARGIAGRQRTVFRSTGVSAARAGPAPNRAPSNRQAKTIDRGERRFTWSSSWLPIRSAFVPPRTPLR